jgi:nitroreductase
MPNENQSTGTDLFEIIRTTRSMRRLKPDPVPNELIRKILEAGVCAPSGGNMQRWRFLVIRDPKIKGTVGALYKRAWDERVAPRYRSGEPAPGTSRERFGGKPARPGIGEQVTVLLSNRRVNRPICPARFVDDSLVEGAGFEPRRTAPLCRAGSSDQEPDNAPLRRCGPVRT